MSPSLSKPHYQESTLKTASVQLSIHSLIYLAHISHSQRGHLPQGMRDLLLNFAMPLTTGPSGQIQDISIPKPSHHTQIYSFYSQITNQPYSTLSPPLLFPPHPPPPPALSRRVL